MKIYVASMWSARDDSRNLARKLILARHGVTSRWLLDSHSGSATPAEQRATWDLEDVDAADALVLVTLPVGTTYEGGGRQVEFGYAVARGKRVFVLGEREHLFCHLPQIVACATVDDLLRELTEREK